MDRELTTCRHECCVATKQLHVLHTMASCRHVEIWKTRSSSHSPKRFGNAKTDQQFPRTYAEEDGNLCRLIALPGRTDGSTSPSGLPDLQQRELKHRLPDIDLLQVRVPEVVPTSGNSDRRSTANEYVDGPAPPAVTRLDGGVSARVDDVKPRSSAGARCATTDCSIICQRCGGCRCDRCCSVGGRPLPGVWCGPRCGYCTPSRVVDVVSCVCCVRAVVYHCSADDDVCKADRDDVDVDEDVDGCPCTCSGSPSQCRRRWACLAALGGLGCLPCLLLYWPLRALLAAGRAAYNAAGRRRGCRCGNSTKKTVQGRLLLVDTESSSA